MSVLGPVRAMASDRRQGWLGVRTLDARRSGPDALAGLLILSVAKDSPADQVGLRATDVLYEVDGRLLRERGDLVSALADCAPGAAVCLTFRRAGQWIERWAPVATQPVRRRRATAF